MLLNDFYKIIEIKPGDPGAGKWQATLELNPAHEIFMGHFPVQPVVPGVCLVQMVKEVSEQITGKKLSMVAADNIKFTSVVAPQIAPMLKMDLLIEMQPSDNFLITNSIFFDTTVYLKFKGTFNQRL